MMRTFPCPGKDEGICVADPGGRVIAVISGQLRVGHRELLDQVFPDGFDAEDAKRIPLDLDDASLRTLRGGDPKALGGRKVEEIIPNHPELVGLTGVVATCTPCGDRWFYEP
jgi:hypothetical protein